MKSFENQTFERFYDRNSGKVFSDIEFRNCTFGSCAISMARNPALRSTIRNVRLIGCEEVSCALHTAIVEDVIVDGLKASGSAGGLFQTWGAVFKHVILKGKVRRVMFSPAVALGLATRDEQQAFDDANAAYYKSIDWAMDISQGEFEECEIQSVPAHLIRRDPETQVVVTRAKAARGEWRKLDLSKTHWPISLDFFLKRGDQDVVLVTPKCSKKFRDLLAGLKMLRDAGIAEPD
jgi:hypothetical protein